MKEKVFNSGLRNSIKYCVLTLVFVSAINLINHFYIHSNRYFNFVFMLIFGVIFFLLPFYSAKKNDWTVLDLGFDVNLTSIIISVVLLALFTYKGGFTLYKETYYQSIVEGIMRTGEELFVRGFIYYVVLKVCEGDHHKHLKAMVISSLYFTLAHTSIFLGKYHMGFIGMFVNTFLIFSTMRYICKSLLPVIVLHTFLNGGILSTIIGTLIFIGVKARYSKIRRNVSIQI